MTDKKPVDGQCVTRQKYTPAFKAECVRQVAAGCPANRCSPCSGHLTRPARPLAAPRQALEQAVPSSAERNEYKRLRAELKRVEIERDMLKKAVTIFAQPQP